MLIGNASAPRWWDLESERFLAYLDLLQRVGAISTELVLIHGEYDLETVRVHILERDWAPTISALRSRDIACQFHAPLHPRFALDQWAADADALKREFRPIIDTVAAVAREQQGGAAFVVHGGRVPDATRSFVRWLAEQFSRVDAPVRLSLELRKPARSDVGFDGGRGELAGFIQSLDVSTAGICWDLSHDWEGRAVHAGWTPEPSAEFLDLVNHVHAHGASPDGLAVHWPLQSGDVPWREMLAPLVRNGYVGAVTMELRFRYAMQLGDPWLALTESYRQLSEVVNQHREQNTRHV